MPYLKHELRLRTIGCIIMNALVRNDTFVSPAAVELISTGGGVFETGGTLSRLFAAWNFLKPMEIFTAAFFTSGSSRSMSITSSSGGADG